MRTVLERLLPDWGIAAGSVERFVHGTTVATNAVLERKGARLGLLTSAGFEDVIEIGRQNRRQIYELLLEPETPGFLAPGARRQGVIESIRPDRRDRDAASTWRRSNVRSTGCSPRGSKRSRSASSSPS